MTETETDTLEVAFGIVAAAQVVALKLLDLFPYHVKLTEQAIRDYRPLNDETPGDLEGISRESFSLRELVTAVFSYFTSPQHPVGWPEIWGFLRQHAYDCLQDPSRRAHFVRRCDGDCLNCDH